MLTVPGWDRAPRGGVRAALGLRSPAGFGRCGQAAAAGSLTKGSSLNGAMVFQCDVACPLNRPFIVLLEQYGADQAGNRCGTLKQVLRLYVPLVGRGGVDRLGIAVVTFVGC